jgi:predicted transcriptional regulator
MTAMNETPSLEDRVKQHAENAVVEFISSSGWLQPDYNKRITVPADILESAWKLVDRDMIIAQLKERIERELADRLINHIAAEMATDVKQLLGVPERREAIRALARTHLESIMGKGSL